MNFAFFGIFALLEQILGFYTIIIENFMDLVRYIKTFSTRRKLHEVSDTMVLRDGRKV